MYETARVLQVEETSLHHGESSGDNPQHRRYELRPRISSEAEEVGETAATEMSLPDKLRRHSTRQSSPFVTAKAMSTGNQGSGRDTVTTETGYMSKSTASQASMNERTQEKRLTR